MISFHKREFKTHELHTHAQKERKRKRWGLAARCARLSAADSLR